MKIQQLRFLAAVAQSDLNITAASAKVFATQPALSKQLRQLEDELGFNIFVRRGRTLEKVTPAGEQVIRHALKILREVQNIKGVSTELRGEERGSLAIGTTHTQARYVLPPIIQRFRIDHPDVQFHLHEGTSEQIAQLAQLDRLDLAIATGSRDLFEKLVLLPCYQWRRRIIVPRDHPLAGSTAPSLQELAEYPIVTYMFSFVDPSSLNATFAKAGLTPNVVLTASDAEVIKTYVRVGLGVGIIADVALDPARDDDLVALDTDHLFSPHTTWIGFARDGLLRRYACDFIGLMAPHLDRGVVEHAAACSSQDEVDAMFARIPLPHL
jgi:LysR family transcriptional regulator, cys regulon transcriptional activator